MSGTKRKFPRCLSALALLLAVVLILTLALVLPWQERMSIYDGEIEQRNRQLSGYLRVIDTLPDLQARLDSARSNRDQDAFYLAATDPSLGGIALQRRIEGLVTASEGNLTSIQILPLQDEGSVTRIGVRLRFTGPTEALQKLLYGIESNQPALFIGTVNIRSLKRNTRRRPRSKQQQPPKKTPTNLNVNLDVHGYIRRAAG